MDCTVVSVRSTVKKTIPHTTEKLVLVMDATPPRVLPVSSHIRFCSFVDSTFVTFTLLMMAFWHIVLFTSMFTRTLFV